MLVERWLTLEPQHTHDQKDLLQLLVTHGPILMTRVQSEREMLPPMRHCVCHSLAELD